MKTWGKQKGSGFGDPLCAFPCVNEGSQRESELGPLPLSCALVGWGSQRGLVLKGSLGAGPLCNVPPHPTGWREARGSRSPA